MKKQQDQVFTLEQYYGVIQTQMAMIRKSTENIISDMEMVLSNFIKREFDKATMSTLNVSQGAQQPGSEDKSKLQNKEFSKVALINPKELEINIISQLVPIIHNMEKESKTLTDKILSSSTTNFQMSQVFDQFKTYNPTVYHMVDLEDSNLFAIATEKNSVYIIDCEEMVVQKSLNGIKAEYFHCIQKFAGSQIAVATRDPCKVLIFDYKNEDPNPEQKLEHQSYILSMCYFDDKLITSDTKGFTLKSYLKDSGDRDNLSFEKNFGHHSNYIMTIAPLDKQYFASSGTDKFVQIWHQRSLEQQGQIKLSGEVREIKALSETQFIATLYDPGELQVWLWKTKENIYKFQTIATSLENLLVLSDNLVVVPFFYSNQHPLMFNLQENTFKTFGDLSPQKNIQTASIIKIQKSGDYIAYTNVGIIKLK